MAFYWKIVFFIKWSYFLQVLQNIDVKQFLWTLHWTLFFFSDIQFYEILLWTFTMHINKLVLTWKLEICQRKQARSFQKSRLIFQKKCSYGNRGLLSCFVFFAKKTVHNTIGPNIFWSCSWIFVSLQLWLGGFEKISFLSWPFLKKIYKTFLCFIPLKIYQSFLGHSHYPAASSH